MVPDKGRALSRLLLVFSAGALAVSLASIDSAFENIEQYYFGQMALSGDNTFNSANKTMGQIANKATKTVEQADTAASETLVVAGRTINDTILAAKVKAALIGARSLDFSNITVGATNGVVTLAGTTEDATKRDFAEWLALSVEGVTAVRNEIMIARLMSSRIGCYGELT
jgi:hyperosmotically inducible protein